MSDAIKKLHDYLAKSPSVVYPEDVLAYLPAIEAENAKLRERIHELEMEGSDHFYRMAYAEDANRTLEAENARLRDLMYDRAHDYAIQHMTEDELRITAANALDENCKLLELVRDMMRYYFMPSAIDSKQRETELLERAHELGVKKNNDELWSEVDK